MKRYKESKICKSCGRPFENRKKWKDDFDNIKYCSKQCRSNKVPKKYMDKLLGLLRSDRNLLIRPSDALPVERRNEQEYLEKMRSAARLLYHLGEIEIIQNKKVIGPDFRGQIMVRLKK